MNPLQMNETVASNLDLEAAKFLQATKTKENLRKLELQLNCEAEMGSLTNLNYNVPKKLKKTEIANGESLQSVA